MAKTRQMKPKKQQPEKWATNIRARIRAAEIFGTGKLTETEREMYATMTELYAKIGPERTLEDVKQTIKSEKWKQLFDIYAGFCGRVEHLLIIMMQTNTPMYEGTQMTIKPDRPEILTEIPKEFDCFIHEFRTTYLEKHKYIMLEVYLCKGTTHAPHDLEQGYDLDDLPM